MSGHTEVTIRVVQNIINWQFDYLMFNVESQNIKFKVQILVIMTMWLLYISLVTGPSMVYMQPVE